MWFDEKDTIFQWVSQETENVGCGQGNMSMRFDKKITVRDTAESSDVHVFLWKASDQIVGSFSRYIFDTRICNLTNRKIAGDSACKMFFFCNLIPKINDFEKSLNKYSLEFLQVPKIYLPLASFDQ